MKVEMPFAPISKIETIAPHARWMVVDDDDGVRDFLASVLQTRGLAAVEQFRSATEALTAFAATPNQFQLVITDLDMPGMNGIQLCRQLHALSPDLKIVLATGNGATNEAGARQCGFCGLLSKPFPASELWRTVEAAGVLQRATITARY